MQSWIQCLTCYLKVRKSPPNMKMEHHQLTPKVATSQPSHLTMVALGPIEQTVAAALMYFFPLTQYARTYGPVIEKHGVNAFEHQRVVSSAAESPVTRSNADTLYSLAAIDLSQNDISFTIPEVTDRGHLFPFHDLSVPTQRSVSPRAR